MIETKEAAEDIDNILEVDGLEAIFLGPADMSATYGHLGEVDISALQKKRLSNRDSLFAYIR